MIVVLDTNILYKDFYMRGTQMKLLNKFCTIIIPEIVYDETINKHREKLRELGAAVVKKTEEYNQIADIQEKTNLNDEYYLEEDKKYETFLTKMLRENENYPPIPYPNVSHKEVVGVALKRRKPFKQDGRDGYRDYLVWRSVLDVVKKYSSEIIYFVSENPKDFADDEKKGLHPQLIEEMERLEIDPQRLVYFYNFKEFVDKVIKPELEKSGKQGQIAAELFIENETSSNEIYKRIREFVNTVDIGYYDVLFPGEYSKLTFFEPGMPNEIEDVSCVEKDQILISIRSEYVALIESMAPKGEMTGRNRDLWDNSEIVIDNNDSFIVETEVVLEIKTDIIYNIKEKRIISFEVVDIDDGNCPYCPY